MPQTAVRSKEVGSVVVDILLNVISIVFREFCVCNCFVKHYFVSILVLQSS